MRGIIALYPDRFDHIYQEIQAHNIPAVFIDYDGEIDMSRSPMVMVTNREGIVDAMQYLVSLGHSRIGFITGRPAGRAARERLLGYEDGLIDAGIPYDEMLICRGDWFQESGRDAAQYLLNLDVPPTAIVASNDLMAFGVMEVAREMGYEVGENLSVIGFDDVPMAANVSPLLTTVRQPAYHIGSMAVHMLLELLQGRTPDPLHVYLKTELIKRDSTAPLRV